MSKQRIYTLNGRPVQSLEGFKDLADALRAALDEANTERRRLAAENRNLRESADTAVFVANNVGESYRTERDRREDLSLHLSAAEAERDRLAKDNERISEAWSQAVQREQRADNAHDYDMQQIVVERDEAFDRSRRNLDLALRWQEFEQLARDEWVRAESERDAAIAQVQRVEALCDEVDSDPRRGRTHDGGLFPAILSTTRIRAALAGEGNGEPDGA